MYQNFLLLVTLPLRVTGTELLIEFAVIVDVVEAFVKATYSLEGGDGPLALRHYHLLCK